MTGFAPVFFGGQGGGAGPAVRGVRRRYLGSEDIRTSKIWLKSEAATLPFLADVDLDLVEVDLACVGGGGCSGLGTTAPTAPALGGMGAVPETRTIAFDDMPAEATVVIGAGDITSGGLPRSTENSRGGTTSFGNLLVALGGWSAKFGPLTAGGFTSLHTMPQNAAGNGASMGSSGGTNDAQATASTPAFPDLATPPGTPDSVDGIDAAGPFNFGSGGSANVTVGGKGGVPGGGAGGYSDRQSAGVKIFANGGDGAARAHYYVWEPVI